MPNPPKVLIIDDGDRYAGMAFRFLRSYRYATRCTLEGPCWLCARRKGCELTHAHDVLEAEQALHRHDDVEVVLLDMAFAVPPERLSPSTDLDLDRRRRREGLAILSMVRRRHPALPVILMTSREELLEEADVARLDVDEYVTLAGAEAFDARAVSLLIERILSRRPGRSTGGAYDWGSAPSMAKLKRDAMVLARSRLPVLILGETGVGKSALAEQVVHGESRRKGPFVAVDLSALPDTLQAAELFGTAKGAFSGAVDRPGRFELASGGTLFLDEIGNLPLEAQRLLLLALESGRLTRLGESSPRPVEVRVVAASNGDLRQLVETGRFRGDLLARLNPSAALRVPPLRERIGDLPGLAAAFLRRAFTTAAHRELLDDYAREIGHPPGMSARLVFGAPEEGDGIQFVLSTASLRAMRAHAFPGNLRELDHLIVTAALMTLADALQAVESGRAATGNPYWLPVPSKEIRDLITQAPTGATGGPAPTPRAPAATLHGYMASLEADLLQSLWHETGGDFTAMAKRLLLGPPAKNARRVRLRFNQLGLRARGGRGYSK